MSARTFLPARMYFKVNQKCLGDNHCGVWRASRFLWSIHTPNGNLLPSRRWHQVMRAHQTAKASFSHMAHLYSVSMSLQDVYVHGYNVPCSLPCNRTVATAILLVSTWTTKACSGFGYFRRGSLANNSLRDLNACWHSIIQCSGWPGLGFNIVCLVLRRSVKGKATLANVEMKIR